MNIKFDYDMTREEIRAGLRFAYSKARVKTYLALAVVISSVLVLLFMNTEPLGVFFNLTVAFGIVIVAFPLWLFEYVIPVQVTDKVYRAQLGHGHTTMCLTDDGLRVVSDVGESQQQWKLFSKYRENDRLILLYLPNGQSLTIPKRMMRAEEVAELVGVLAQHLEGRG
jgi:hypothetical protein